MGAFTERSTAVFVFLLFFFQAEDGIRDDLVTGVQTCALPIFRSPKDSGSRVLGAVAIAAVTLVAGGVLIASAAPDGIWSLVGKLGLTAQTAPWLRSEERRVGKEGRSRWGPET